MDTDLLQHTLECFFESDEGREVLDEFCWHHSADSPGIEVDDLEFNEVTGIATFVVVSTGTDLQSYSYGERGHHGMEVFSISPGQCTYHLELSFKGKDDLKINLDSLKCISAETTATVGDLR